MALSLTGRQKHPRAGWWSLCWVQESYKSLCLVPVFFSSSCQCCERQEAGREGKIKPCPFPVAGCSPQGRVISEGMAQWGFL